MSKSQKGRKLTEEHKRKIGDAFRGKKLTEEHKRKVAAALRGKPKSKAHLANFSRAMRNSAKAQASSRANLKKACAVNHKYHAKRIATLRTPEVRAKMSASLKAFYASDRGQETKAHLSELAKQRSTKKRGGNG